MTNIDQAQALNAMSREIRSAAASVYRLTRNLQGEMTGAQNRMKSGQRAHYGMDSQVVGQTARDLNEKNARLTTLLETAHLVGMTGEQIAIAYEMGVKDGETAW